MGGQPPVTEEQPPSTESQQTPPARPTTDNVTVTKTERFKKSLENSTSKSLTALENALEKAPPQAKPNLQRAIDTIWEKSREKQSSDNQTVDGGKYKPTPAWPEPSQPTTQSDNITKNEGKPNPFSPRQNQPSSSRWSNTGK
jgi:hypothetical protein